MSGRAAKRARRDQSTTITSDGGSGALVRELRQASRSHVRSVVKCECFLQEGEHTETQACRDAEQAFLVWWKGQMA